MITLCRFSISNYYNKVKLALLEKGVPFEEERVMTGSKDEAVLAASPLGKIPYIRTPQGALCESQVIVDWIEAAYPNPPLIPADPFAAAKVRELATFIDLHLASCTRRPSSAGRSARARRHACASNWSATSRPSSVWRPSRPMWPVTASHSQIARRG